MIFNCVIWFNSFLQELVNIFSRLLQQITVGEIVVLFISVIFEIFLDIRVLRKNSEDEVTDSKYVSSIEHYSMVNFN